MNIYPKWSLSYRFFPFTFVHNFLLSLIFALSLFGFAYSKPDNNSASLEQVVLQLPYYHMFNYAGFYAVQEKGFFQNNGIKVEIREGDAQKTPVDIVESGQAHFGVQNDDLLLEYLAGKDVIVLAAIFQHSPWALMVNAESPIFSPKELAGKKIMLELSSRDATILAMIKHAGVPPEDLNIIRNRWGEFPIFSGEVDAQSVYLNDPKFVFLRNEGRTFRFLRPSSYGIDFYGDALFTSQEVITRNPKLVSGFRSAALKGWEYALEHQEEVFDIILAKGDVHKRGVTRESLEFEAAETAKLMDYPLIEIGHMNWNRWEKMAETYISLGMANPNYSLEDFLYDPHPNQDSNLVQWIAVGSSGYCLLEPNKYSQSKFSDLENVSNNAKLSRQPEKSKVLNLIFV